MKKKTQTKTKVGWQLYDKPVDVNRENGKITWVEIEGKRYTVSDGRPLSKKDVAEIKRLKAQHQKGDLISPSSF